MLNPYQIGGFVVGEGCFYIDISKDTSYRCGFHCRLGFEIELRDDDEPILQEIKAILGCGHVYKLEYRRYHKWKPHAKYRVTNFREIYDKVIPFFQQYSLFGQKAKSFECFCRAAEIMQKNQHITQEGIEQLRTIKSSMNKYGK